jgi:hypothetical protein
MFNPHIAIGIIALAITVLYLVEKYLRAAKQSRLPWWGWVGLAIIFAAEFLDFLHIPWVTIYFTPLVWTGYLLLADALVVSLEGESLLSRTPGRFLMLAFWSVPLWLIFEAYNLRLQNWKYVGLPESVLLSGLGYAWSFATIWPAIFETAELLRALGLFKPANRTRGPFHTSTCVGLIACGAALVIIPVVVPVSVGRYLFGAIWIGFILLLDPLNYLWNGFSFLREWQAGRSAAFWSFMAAGWVCGILWEFWNYWAGAKWIYIFPLGQGWKIFEMPLAGYLGFLPFALECKVMYEFLRTLKTRLGPERRIVSWDTAHSRTA